MFGHTYYHQTLRRYVVVFGTLFNQITITKEDGTGAVVKRLKVPISYGPKERFLARLDSDPALSQPFALTLPRMGFEITNMSYAGDRKLGTTTRFKGTDPTDPSRNKTVYAPVPYDISFQLNIVAKSVEDGTKIVEQILPFFTPEWTTTIRIVDDPVVVLDVPIILNGVTTSDTYDSDFQSRRAITWTLDFVMKGYFFGPVSSKKIIKFANTSLFDAMTALDPASRVLVQPGLTANGEPTTDINLTIPYQDIEVTDNWDYIVTIEEPSSG